MYALSWMPAPFSALKWVKMNSGLTLSLATAGIKIVSTNSTCNVPESSKLAKPGEPSYGKAVDEAVQDEDGRVDGQHDVLGRHVAAAVGASRGKQDDHLEKLRQREIHARRASPLEDQAHQPVTQEARGAHSFPASLALQ
ncbi:Os01g0945650 [Oryza sativa Japonica Group]|uniref:Os01g0945650 protein n=1 Tax=Oryza sativa subsp. japonica TaxID=39947 RepID=A0A0P0VCT1_ORYSJ|nr:hypothetical protein EE612_007936 [Oryza sativa]BAS76195.1 Os01g0945650 [Oryza sativa Japonica Group]